MHKDTKRVASELGRIAISEQDIGWASIYIRSAKEYKDKREHPHIYEVLFKMAIICYCRPFLNNKGDAAKTLPNPSKYIQYLKKSDISLPKLHKEIKDVRNQLIAHSDSQHYKVEIGGIGLSHGQEILEKRDEFEKLTGLCYSWIIHARSATEKKLKAQNL